MEKHLRVLFVVFLDMFFLTANLHGEGCILEMAQSNCEVHTLVRETVWNQIGQDC